MLGRVEDSVLGVRAGRTRKDAARHESKVNPEAGMSSEPQPPEPPNDTDSELKWCTCKGDVQASWSAHGGLTGQSSAQCHALQLLRAAAVAAAGLQL